MLDLSQNRISSVRGLAAVPSLVALILGESVRIPVSDIAFRKRESAVKLVRFVVCALCLIFAALDDSHS